VYASVVTGQATSPYYVMPYVIWNFPNTKNITMANIGFRGSILAPDAGLLHARLFANTRAFGQLIVFAM
jgi:choice-of-anchor A domain-containing protein